MSFERGVSHRIMPLLVLLLLLLSIPSPATAKVPKFKWDYDAGWKVTSVAISPTGKLIAAGSANGDVHVFHENESLSWSYEVESGVQDVAISYYGNVLVGDGDSVYLINATGGLIWENFIGDYVRSVAFSPEGDYIVAGSSDNRVYLFDEEGTRLWKYSTGSSVQGVTVSTKGDRISAGAGTNFFLLNNAGNLLWKHGIGSFIWDVVTSTDGSKTVVGARGIYLLDTEKEEFIYRPPIGDEIRGVTMSEDGEKILAGGASGHIYAYNSAGRQQWSYQFNDSVMGVGMGPRGELMAVASGDNIYLMEPPDTTPPKVEISLVTDPESGEVRIFTSVDDSEAELKIFVDGEPLRNLTYLWDTSSATEGNHTIRVEATDVAGNTGHATTTVQISEESAVEVGEEEAVEEKKEEEETVSEEVPEETPAPTEEEDKTGTEKLQEEIESYRDILLPLGKPEKTPLERYGKFLIAGIALIVALWFLNTLRRFRSSDDKKYRWKK